MQICIALGDVPKRLESLVHAHRADLEQSPNSRKAASTSEQGNRKHEDPVYRGSCRSPPKGRQSEPGGVVTRPARTLYTADNPSAACGCVFVSTSRSSS